MNSIADMGGMHGFGAVAPDDAWKPFAHDWEKRILGVQFATLSAGMFPVDLIRFATESLPPAQYLASSYFARWVWTVENLLRDLSIASDSELATGRAERPPVACTVDAAVARAVVAAGGSSRTAEGRPARFRTGDRVRARNMHPAGHTRLPRYVRGHEGEVIRDYGTFVFPDSNAAGEGPRPQHVYCVRFAAQTLWGPEASPRDTLQIDLFDDYLDPVS